MTIFGCPESVEKAEKRRYSDREREVEEEGEVRLFFVVYQGEGLGREAELEREADFNPHYSAVPVGSFFCPTLAN